MNLPNKLTVLRVILIPFFVVSMMIENGANQTFRYVAAAIFIIASLTDMLDGKIARKYKQDGLFTVQYQGSKGGEKQQTFYNESFSRRKT